MLSNGGSYHIPGSPYVEPSKSDWDKILGEKPEKQKSKVVRISMEVNDHLKKLARKGETPDDVLRRLFDLKPNDRRLTWRQ
jgi:ribosome recycling factor